MTAGVGDVGVPGEPTADGVDVLVEPCGVDIVAGAQNFGTGGIGQGGVADLVGCLAVRLARIAFRVVDEAAGASALGGCRGAALQGSSSGAADGAAGPQGGALRHFPGSTCPRRASCLLDTFEPPNTFEPPGGDPAGTEGGQREDVQRHVGPGPVAREGERPVPAQGPDSQSDREPLDDVHARDEQRQDRQRGGHSAQDLSDSRDPPGVVVDPVLNRVPPAVFHVVVNGVVDPPGVMTAHAIGVFDRVIQLPSRGG